MTQIIENWSSLDCELVDFSDSGQWLEIIVRIEKSEDVESFANLIEATDHKIKIRLKQPFNRTLLAKRFRIKARRASADIIWGDASSLWNY